ncbi:unnamed protein product [Penicillium salamii]|uniref:C2H2-type domain-containing protein n=1 Tax=Penicillium salamii TaxID=1612424 RepID=A0A9W4J5N3_9EURO|nr:unnamed protein product [Penicillium salamii]
MSPPGNHDHNDDWGSDPFEIPSSSRAQQFYFGSFPSSYDQSNTDPDGYNHVYHSGTHPSTETSSLTSFSQNQENMDSFLPDSSLATLCPPPQGDEFDDFIGVAGSISQWEKMPENLDNELGIQNDPIQAPQTVPFQAFQVPTVQTTDLATISSRALMGVPSSTHPSLQHQSPEDPISQVWRIYHNIKSGHAYSHDEIMRAKGNVPALNAFFDSKLPNNPPSTPSESSPQDRGYYQCRLCEADGKRAVIKSFGSFKRHLASLHEIAVLKYPCLVPDCRKETFVRRDRLREHLALAHTVDPNRDYVNTVRRKVDAPRTCPICGGRTRSWDRFWEHIKHHCHIPPGPASVSTDDDRSRRGGDGGGGNGGNGPGPSHNRPSFAGPSSANRQSRSYQGSQQSDPRNFIHPGYQRGYMNNARTNIRPYSLMHSISDNQLDFGRHQELDDAAKDHPVNTPFEKFDDSDIDMAGGVGQQSSLIQPLQDPWSPQVDRPVPKHKRLQKCKRSNRPRAPTEPSTEQQPPSSRECTICGHDCERCQKCQHRTEPIIGCHDCADGAGARIQTLPSEPSVQSRPNELSPIGALNEQSFRSIFPEGYVWLSQGPSQEPYPHPNYTTEYTGPYPGSGYQRHSFDNTGTGYSDDVSPGGTMIRAAMVPEDHGLVHSLDPKTLQSPTLYRDFRLLYDVGLGSLVKSKSPQGQFKQVMNKASFGLSPEPYPGLPLKTRGPSMLESPQSVPQCQCPCVILPGTTYKAHLRAQLSPWELVEMTFNMTPADRESNHPLRTRVQVVVRLLRLRASVSKSNAKRKRRKQSIKSEATSEDDAGSETDSDHALSPTSPSGSEDSPVFLWTEDVQDWSFSFDLKWAISRFAKWTSGINADTYLKLFQSDPGHILDLVSLYIMYNYKEVWLRAARLDSLLKRLMIS